MYMTNILIFGIILVTSCAITGIVRIYANQQSMIDLPNERSSHTIPTPRGGGLGIVVTFLVALLYLYFKEYLSETLFAALFGGSLPIATIGFLDDHKHVASYWRIIVHFTAVAWALILLDGVPPILIGKVFWKLGWAGNLVGVFFLVWLLNLFNFMDGIDGIAAIEAIFVAGGAAVIMYYRKVTFEPFLLSLLVAACLGFLVWNWPPAKIFMGDVGSGFLGFVLGVFIIYTTAGKFLTFWTWMILLGVFLVDATITLLRRILTKQRWYEAHCNHAYQWAARRYQSHKKVTLAVLGINLVWLLPLALCATIFPDAGLLLTLISYLPLAFMVFKFNAGLEAGSI